ncbi:MAG: hypothetical protein Q9162_000913 [Coniocarpon cinnabarinum]
MASSAPGQIAHAVQENLDLFAKSLETMEGPPLTASQDNLGRFRLWAGNIGALHTGRSSLSNRLGTSRLVQEISRLLDQLKESLQYLVGDQGGEALEAEDYDDIFDTMALTITSLLKTSALIRHNPERDPWKRILSRPPWLSQPMTDNALQRWPKLSRSPWLADRLGLANSRRRQFFQYREEHVAKLAKPAQDEVSETVPTTFEGNPQMQWQQASDVVQDDAVSDTTFATTFGLDESTKMTIPPLPPNHEKSEVECTLCHNIIDLPNARAWKLVSQTIGV